MPTPPASPTPAVAHRQQPKPQSPQPVPSPTAQAILDTQQEILKLLQEATKPNSPDGTTSAMKAMDTKDLEQTTQKQTLEAVIELKNLIVTLIGFFQSPSTSAKLQEIMAGRSPK
jgi:hypothetical protein